MAAAGVLLSLLIVKCASGHYCDHFDNATLLPSSRQLLDFKLRHPEPIGLLTVDSGTPVEIRDTIAINSDLFKNDYLFDTQNHLDGERVPERIVHAKGFGAWGYFEVTNDVSKYTKAELFNGIGKKTPALIRFSVGTPEKGGSDLTRDFKGFVVKFYTKEGNLDFLNLNPPMFTFKDPNDFTPFLHKNFRNPRSNLYDFTQVWDFFSLRPAGLTSFLYLLSDYGVPDGFRYMDCFPIHTYELVNKHGERWFARFNFRSEQGFKFLTDQQIQAIQGTDLDYYIRDIYNALENKTYPAWRLDIDVLSLQDIQTVDYNPFDMTRLWKNGTYKTVTIGRLVVERSSDNHFRDQEQGAWNPASLVPGIPGPIDSIFRSRRLAYRDTQNYRIGRNHNKVGVNAPRFSVKSYDRDGHPPVWDNMRDAPTYYPNSFNGPLPLVDDLRPKEYLQVLESNAADLQEPADFYDNFLIDDASKQRLADTITTMLQTTSEPVRSKTLKLLGLAIPDLAQRITAGLWQSSRV